MMYSGTIAGLVSAALLALPARAQNGSVEGRVVNALSGEGLRKVTVTLTATGSKGQPVTMQSDESGRFAFGGLAPGGYRLSGQRNGFQRQEYGWRRNPGSGTVLAVSPGREIKDLSFPLAPDAILSGRVLDQEGEPMPNLMVTALRNGYVRGRRDWMAAGGAQTNDRGEFRVAGLRAGRYLVRAQNLNLGIGLAGIGKDPGSGKPEAAYTCTYFGNATDIARAVPVEVRMGEDRRGTDIQMAKTSAVRVKGKVTGAFEGKVLVVMLQPKSYEGRPTGVALVQQADGTFEVRNVGPGSYVLSVRSATDVTSSAAVPVPLEVGESHIEGIEVPLSAGGTQQGRVTISPASPNGAKNPSIVLEPADFPFLGPSSATAADDGRFDVKGVFAGPYRLRVDDLPENGYIKSVKLGGHPADESGMELSGGADLEIAVSRTGAQVDGVVSGPEGKPAAGAVVALIPESGRESSYRSATADYDGSFRLKGIPPGAYKVLAWEDVEPGAHRDPEFVKPFEAQAQAVTLEENGRSKLNLKAIPAESR